LDDLPDELLTRCVAPFYLNMMNRNVLQHRVAYKKLVAASHSTTDLEVISLLGSHWRPRVMGAWLSAGRRSSGVCIAMLGSLVTSLGSLTAPPLATMAILLAGNTAIPALETYLRSDVSHNWGSAGFVAAAIERAGGTLEDIRPDTRDRDALEKMLSVGRRLGKLTFGVNADLCEHN
jgi:hypothetical protein